MAFGDQRFRHRDHAVDVAAAVDIAAAFRAKGVPAEVVSADTPDTLRSAILRRFRAREILQLVNVDLFGEGFDLASQTGMDVSIECVGLARPTQSLALHLQQIGRALRPKTEPAMTNPRTATSA